MDNKAHHTHDQSRRVECWMLIVIKWHISLVMHSILFCQLATPWKVVSDPWPSVWERLFERLCWVLDGDIWTSPKVLLFFFFTVFFFKMCHNLKATLNGGRAFFFFVVATKKYANVSVQDSGFFYCQCTVHAGNMSVPPRETQLTQPTRRERDPRKTWPTHLSSHIGTF